MPDRAALSAPLGGDWRIVAAGIARERDRRLTADLVLHNGVPVYQARIALNEPRARAAFAAAATDRDRPLAAAIAAAVLALVPEALAVVQEPDARPTQAEQLVGYAADLELWHTADGQPYATLAADGHREHWPLGARHVRDWLAYRHYQATGKAPGGQAMQDALNVLAGRARFEGAEHAVQVRLAEHGGAIYLDLADDRWRAVTIDAAGWRVVEAPPVRFRRPRGLAPLPAPVPGGSLDALRPFLNVGDDDDWRLLVAWLLAALRPRGPYPLLGLHGEQGSAKSTTAKVLRALVDPGAVPLRSEPREERDLAIAAGNAWVLGYDNLSRLPTWLSDALCRIATGGGFGTRQLYSDDEEALFDFTRPVIVNGIEDLATRPDLLERMLVRHLPAIPEERRRDEATFWRDFDAARPAILGALLDAVAAALGNLPHTTLARKPRLADFALWVTAAEPALGWEPGAFLRAFAGNRAALNDLALDDEVAAALRRLAERHTAAAPWEGTATQLLAALDDDAPEATRQARAKDRDWPKNGRALSGRLRRYAPNLRAAGCTVDLDRRAPGGKRERRVALSQNGPVSDRPDRPDRPLASGGAADGGTVAGRSGRSWGEPPAATVPPSAGENTSGGKESGTDRDGRDGRDGVLPP